MINRVTVLLCLGLFCTANCFSQELDNGIKVNLSSLILKNISLQYERGLTSKISVALGFRFEPKGAIPLQTQVQNFVTTGDFDFSNLTTSNIAITPEVRFYLGHRPQTGFYIAPYARYASFTMSVPLNYQSDNNTKEAVFDGSANSFSGGVMFGLQYHIAKIIILDIWLIGAHYGSSSGTGTYTAGEALSQQDQQGLQQAIDNVDVKPFNFGGTVNSTGAVIKANGPWAGVRALGINVGVRF